MPNTLDQYDPVFQAAGTEWNVDPLLLKSIGGVESSGDPKAISRDKSGNPIAYGLMQITGPTQQELGVADWSDPVQSIFGAAKYMSQALDAEKTPEEALLYYHGGPDWRSRFGAESRNYVPKVTAQYQQLVKAAAQAPQQQPQATQQAQQ